MKSKLKSCLAQLGERSGMVVFMTLVISMSNVGLSPPTQAAINNSPVGSGFVITAADLRFILKQIKIAERHARAFQNDPKAVYAGGVTAAPPNPNLATDPSYCLSMIGTAPDQIPDILTSYGLRTVAGDCNNLRKSTDNVIDVTFGAADKPFPRITNPVFRDAQDAPQGFPPNPAPHPGFNTQTTYKQLLNGNIVYDSRPRLISNLIVDQTASNPAALDAALNPVRVQGGGNPSQPPCTTDPVLDPITHAEITSGVPVGCIPSHQTLFIENVTTDVGLSPPYNSLFTFFGQFFDHGVDQTVKSGGTVIVPLLADDPLIAGPDHILGNGDDLPPSKRFIPLTRGQNQPGADGILGTADDIQDANNTDTPWVDQSQTYTSHGAHQFFLRDYAMDCDPGCTPNTGHPVSTGKFLDGLPAGQTYAGSPSGLGGISTWAAVKKQALEKFGMSLADTDVTNVPMIHTDPYGNYIAGPARGLPQYVTDGDPNTPGVQPIMVEGDLANPVPVPADVVHFDTPFLTDIAHNADPSKQDTNNDGIPDTFPTPDADNTPSADFANQPAGTYDDEMLDAHFACGDGRCNENIALSMVHQIFHSEHNRLAIEYDTVTFPANPDLQTDYKNTNCPIGCLTNNPALPTTFTYGERLFQAARFVTEMQYQHLVFEEFARKLVPLIRPFHVYSPDANSATKAEFAHAVYRFGHSMLDDDVARINVNPTTNAKTDNSLPLLKAFLNPPEFFNDGNGGFYTAEEAAGAIVMGSADQSGNELDEFINETLRNKLLGLPLDLAAFNLTRARSEGIPPLNEVRRQINAITNDAALAPYTSWADFNEHLKHPNTSLINFIAAYGTHPIIVAQTTMAGKRAAARAIVDPLPADLPNVPCDAVNFLFSLDTDLGSCPSGSNWSTTDTGLEQVDLWVGGLAEVTNLFGGLLGSTFNYVFQTQLELLQEFDRFYYLARTPGMNLRTQLEGNSFSELIMRNTKNTHTLKADPFATADCKFELAHLQLPPGSPFTPIVADDPSTTDCDESKVLIRLSDGTIKYKAVNPVDPPGINGQSVYNGTDLADFIYGGNDNDTFWGGDGNDRIEGNGGDDVVLGGNGDDIITDLDGADVLKGGPGNDAIDAGPGDDILLSNAGFDFTNGGLNDNETFAGPDNDFVIAGVGADAVFGDDGDDWIEGGTGQDLLQGDHGAPFFDDPGKTNPGNEIFVGQAGENDYDAEGGNDLMAQNAAIDRNAGAAGFDWAFHQYNTIATDDDMEINKVLVGLPIQIVVNRDRWQETEADSGDKFNDIIHGTTDALPLGGGGFTGCDALDLAGVARIVDLNKLVTSFPTPTATVVAASQILDANGNPFCPLNGAVNSNGTGGPAGVGSGNVWAEGNILLGGGGSDQLEGRGNNDIIDGDHALRVRIGINGLAGGAASADLMENVPTGPGWTGALTGKTLQKAVFDGLVNPGQLVAVREILNQDSTGATSPMGASADNNSAGDCTAATPVNCDQALFSGPSNEYTVTVNPNGSVTVTDLADATVVVAPITPTVPRSLDGQDTLWNIERLSFCTTPGAVKGTCAVRAAPISVVPNAAVTPASVPFGNQVVGTTSAAQTVTVSNTGLKSLSLNSVGITGTDAASFLPLAAGTTCTATTVLASGISCIVNVQFSPTTGGAKTASLSIGHNASGSPSLVTLTGTGVVVVAPAVPTLVADAFNRANANTLGANWQQNVVLGLAVLRVNTNQATANLLGASGSAYFITVGGSTQGAGFTYANATVNNTALYLKATGPRGAVGGQMQNAVRVLYNNGTFTVSTTTNGNAIAPTYTAVGAAISTGGALVNGNSLRAVVDNTGRVWVWKMVGGATTLLTPLGVQLPNNALWTTGGGQVGMLLPNAGRVDDFVRY